MARRLRRHRSSHRHDLSEATADYAWVITKDNLDGDMKGVTGPRGTRMTRRDIMKNPAKVKFRLIDDDGNIYFYGWLVGTTATGFEPLHDVGIPFGATIIQLREEGRWTTL